MSRAEERAVTETIRPLPLADLEKLLRRNFYGLVFDEAGGGTGDAREKFVAEMMSSDRVAPTMLVTITPQQLVQVSETSGPAISFALAQEVARAQAPLRARLERVARRVAAAAGRTDLSFELEPSGGISAGAYAGFDSRRISVGAQMILLAESEDNLAFILGHEIAHITHRHTRTLAIQNLIVGTLQAVMMVAVAASDAANRRQGGVGMSPESLNWSMATAATVTGVVASGAIETTGINRDEERAADYYGLGYALSAGYRADAGADTTRRMLAYELGTGPSFEIPFLRSHPTTAERVVRLEKWASSSLPTSSSLTEGGARRPAEVAVALPTLSTPAIASSRSTAPCWTTTGRADAVCTTCCDASGCRSHCEPGRERSEDQATAMARAVVKTCWNVDSRSGTNASICTTCCTANVTCSTTCADGH